MRELKVGDKVKIIDNDRFDDCNYAREGVIIDIDYQYVHSVLIRFKDGTTDCGTPGDLELITVKEYLIEDVIKLMRENPERKFKPLNGCESYIYFDVLNDSIKWGEGHFRTLSEVSILWTEYFPEESIESLKITKEKLRMKNLEPLQGYYFERDIFIEEIKKHIPKILELYDFNSRNDKLVTDNFCMFRIEDEYYVLHLESGTMINWYKNLGRSNTCNKNLTLNEFREFLRLLGEDMKSLLNFI